MPSPMHALALVLVAAPPASPPPAAESSETVEATPSQGDVARARELAARAQSAFDDGDHALTSALLAEAHGLDPQPLYLLGQAQAERLAGHCSVAIPLYERYLATEPPADKADAARMNVARCRTTEPPPVVVAPAPAPAPVVSVTTPTQPVDDRGRDRRGRRDVGLIAGGSATFAVGLGATIVGAALFAGAEHASSERAFERTVTGSSIAMGVGVPVAVAGVAMLTAGLVRWTRRRHRAP